MDIIPVMRPWLGREEQEAAAEAIASGWVAQGPRVAAFEAAFAERVGARHAVAVSSCTNGLHLGLLALGVGPGDDVIVPSLSFIATANAVRYTGATPVFADVDLASQNLTAETIEAAATPATKAVIVVHQVGNPADLGHIEALCVRRGWVLLEDAACAAGSSYGHRWIGGDPSLAVFSFHPRKVITTGEGGMITTPDAEVAARLRRLREHGMSMSAADRHTSTQPVLEEYLEVGFNYRMTDVQAAIGLVQLGRLDEIVARRRELADRSRGLLADVPGLSLPCDPPYGRANFQAFSVLLHPEFPINRSQLLGELMVRGISARRGVMAIHLEPAYRDSVTAPLPATETLTADSIILPLFHTITDAEQDRVVRAVHECAVLAPAFTS